MMRSFSLDWPCGLPEAVEQNKHLYPVKTDYRVILRCLRLLDDPELRRVEKPILLTRLFYVDKTPPNIWSGFEWFVGCGKVKRAGSGVKDFDYEQDASEIYSAFMQVYGIDLIDIPQLHWWKFCALLDGAASGETALGNKIRLRHMDDSDAQRDAAMNRAKTDVAIATHVSRSEAAADQELLRRLMSGEAIDDLIRKE